MNFKVNDIVEENGESSYNHVSNRNSWKGQIVKIDNSRQHTIRVKTLSSADGLFKEVWVKDYYLKLSKGTMEEIKNYDKKVLKLAEEAILEEREEEQVEKAKNVLRVILDKRDKAKAIMEDTGKELKEINGSLKIFGKK